MSCLRFPPRLLMLRCQLIALGAIGGLLLAAGTGLAAEKPTIAIKPAKISSNVSSSVKRYLNREKLLAEMEASFLAARKFQVVSRDQDALQAIREEQQFAQSALTAGDAARSGALKNADYLILPEVYRFAFYAKTTKVPNLQKKYFRRDYGTLEINAQIVDTATGQIAATFYLKDSFSTGETMVNRSGGVPNTKHFSDLCKAVSAQMVDQFLALVFPVEIIKVQPGKVYLNRGRDGGYHPGDILQVYEKGELLVDPHTGEQLGSAEEFVGKIKVSKVKPKFTIATILEDKLEGEISVGCIVRKQ
ncbi:CsgG/HfaB family protein [Desulfogranum mediterraneum]|uniref:CsgG/HfaB family protein n=1 Tax=Desulfogranum mediterraneum TaxID=160661 RepID=UPI00041C76CC|nr:CsgG/HfaB family protein [Desulfogranum mediterraneum]